MDATAPKLDTMLKNHMKYMTDRQAVLAQNIANIDTPGYKARDLKPVDFASLANAQSDRLALRVTSPKHITSNAGGSSFATIQQRDTFEISPTQNNVVLEDQMAKISDTGAEFQLSSTMLRKFTQLYRTAAGNK